MTKKILLILFAILIASATLTQQTPKQTSAHYQFPDIHDLEEKINKGDIVHLRKTINDALGCRKDCKDIAEFLNKLLSKIQLRRSVLTSQSESAKQEIVIIEEELVFLKKELEERKGGPNVNVEATKKKIVRFREKIDAFVSRHKNVQGSIEEKKVDIEESEAEIYHLKVNVLVKAKENAAVAHKKVEKITTEISKLQEQLVILQDERKKYQTEARETDKAIVKAEQRIHFLGSKIVHCQKDIKGFQGRIRQDLAAIKNLEARIADLQKQLEQEDANKVIKELKTKIKEQQTLLAEKRIAVKQDEKVIRILGTNAKRFEKVINKQYYRCFNLVEVGEEEIKIQDEESQQKEQEDDNRTQDNETQDSEAQGDEQSDKEEKISYSRRAFKSYLKKVFGYTNSKNIRQSSSDDQKVYFRHLNIFSPIWSKFYGIPYSVGHRNNLEAVDEEFSCAAEQQDDEEVFDGKIVSIDSNLIDVKGKDGEEYKVYLVGCTRIETISQEKEVPEVGDNIFFKGKYRNSSSGRKEYNGHHVTCY